ncbi:hypothetical protein LJK87_12635 [Paenibacillus sp. P25]|nr:hypothetical protein LJK87_12635 [Paenibacillus sp. P25]
MLRIMRMRLCAWSLVLSLLSAVTLVSGPGTAEAVTTGNGSLVYSPATGFLLRQGRHDVCQDYYAQE